VELSPPKKTLLRRQLIVTTHFLQIQTIQPFQNASEIGENMHKVKLTSVRNRKYNTTVYIVT
jgi:hypothetical protein